MNKLVADQHHDLVSLDPSKQFKTSGKALGVHSSRCGKSDVCSEKHGRIYGRFRHRQRGRFPFAMACSSSNRSLVTSSMNPFGHWPIWP